MLPEKFAAWELCEADTRVFTVYDRLYNKIYPSIIPYKKPFVYGRLIINNAPPIFGHIEIELENQPSYTLAYCITPHQVRTMIEYPENLPIVIFAEPFSYSRSRPVNMYTIDAIDADDEDYKNMFMNLYKKTLHLTQYY
jgi:hypothetical protein